MLLLAPHPTAVTLISSRDTSWGAPKIRERLSRLYPDIHKPAISTVHAVLDRHGLVKRRRARRNRANGTALSFPGQPNELWCADYKGEFMLADRRYCYPLTITDFASRYVFACEALSTTKKAYAFSVFEAVFKQFGLPKAIRTDNGVPFASPNSLRQVESPAVLTLRRACSVRNGVWAPKATATVSAPADHQARPASSRIRSLVDAPTSNAALTAPPADGIATCRPAPKAATARRADVRAAVGT